MRKTIERTQIDIIASCDFCGKDNSLGERVRVCHICGKDVCGNCGIRTDHWSLENGVWSESSPDHYCLPCWELGKAIREQILDFRQKEISLWQQWKQLAK